MEKEEEVEEERYFEEEEEEEDDGERGNVVPEVRQYPDLLMTL